MAPDDCICPPNPRAETGTNLKASQVRHLKCTGKLPREVRKQRIARMASSSHWDEPGFLVQDPRSCFVLHKEKCIRVPDSSDVEDLFEKRGKARSLHDKNGRVFANKKHGAPCSCVVSNVLQPEFFIITGKGHSAMMEGAVWCRPAFVCEVQSADRGKGEASGELQQFLYVIGNWSRQATKPKI